MTILLLHRCDPDQNAFREYRFAFEPIATGWQVTRQRRRGYALAAAGDHVTTWFAPVLKATPTVDPQAITQALAGRPKPARRRRPRGAWRAHAERTIAAIRNARKVGTQALASLTEMLAEWQPLRDLRTKTDLAMETHSV